MTEKWIRDTGLVFSLVFLVVGFNGNQALLMISGVLLAVTMFIPKTLYPLAFVWLKLVELLNLVVPKFFFGVVFFVIILPIGVSRRFLKGDTLLISNWREMSTSFVERNHLFSRQDLETIY
ncbi:MAG: hypothetical protein KAR00_02025 [Candidatus Pacebacteria bacterium]|nr:hypothetical protein [Candidatus Paceibacterota bacterium]